MANYLSDRQRVELLVPPLLAYRLATNVRNHPGTTAQDVDRLNAIVGNFDRAIQEVVGDEIKRKQKLLRRADRALDSALPGDDASFAALLLATKLLIDRLVEARFIAIHDGGAFDVAWTDLAEGLESADETNALDTPERRSEANVVYQQMRQALADHGLYRQ